MMSSSSRVKFASEEVIDRFLANVDVWQALFEMLPVKDRIRLEMTNKRLRIFMYECWKRVTSFDANCELRSYYPSMSRNCEKLSAPLIAICVDRIGDGLRSLTLREKLIPVADWRASLRSIAEGCPNIETITFVYQGGSRKLDVNFDSFSHLKALTVSPGAFIRASASIFLSIPTSIEVIRGLDGKMEEPFENAAQMEVFFADRPSLREVSLAGLFTEDESKADIFRVIAERCPHLKSIELPCSFSNCIIHRGVVALESMKELRIPGAVLNEMEIVRICERSPLVEALEFHLCFSSNLGLQSAALNALGALTKLSRLCFKDIDYGDGRVVAPSLVTEFVRELARNSGASLRCLSLNYTMPLPTAAIEAVANGCGMLRHVEFRVRIGEATPASIRFLIDCIVAHPSWILQTDEWTLFISINVLCGGGDEYIAGLAAFKALAARAANLPSGVLLTIR